VKPIHAKVAAAGIGAICLGAVVGGTTALGLPLPGILMFSAMWTPLSYEAAVTFYGIHKPKEPSHDA